MISPRNPRRNAVLLSRFACPGPNQGSPWLCIDSRNRLTPTNFIASFDLRPSHSFEAAASRESVLPWPRLQLSLLLAPLAHDRSRWRRVPGFPFFSTLLGNCIGLEAVIVPPATSPHRRSIRVDLPPPEVVPRRQRRILRALRRSFAICLAEQVRCSEVRRAPSPTVACQRRTPFTNVSAILLTFR